jgi:hypothetical protein
VTPSQASVSAGVRLLRRLSLGRRPATASQLEGPRSRLAGRQLEVKLEVRRPGSRYCPAGHGSTGPHSGRRKWPVFSLSSSHCTWRQAQASTVTELLPRPRRPGMIITGTCMSSSVIATISKEFESTPSPSRRDAATSPTGADALVVRQSPPASRRPGSGDSALSQNSAGPPPVRNESRSLPSESASARPGGPGPARLGRATGTRAGLEGPGSESQPAVGRP